MKKTNIDHVAPIRILIANDHALLRTGLRTLLEVHSDFVLVGEAQDGAEAMELAGQLRPDILLLDLSMPGLSAKVLQQLVGIRDMHVILFTAAIQQGEVREAFRLGVSGLVLMESPTDFIFKGIRAVMAGDYWQGNRAVSKRVAARYKPLAKASVAGR